MLSNPASRPRRTRLRVLVAASLAAVILVLAGIWLGGHPSHLPGLLRGSPFERHRTELVTEQALNILTERYYRPLERSSLVDEGLAGMVASLDDPYSRYIDPSSYAASNDESNTPTTGIGIDATPEPGGLRVLSVIERSPAAEAGLMRGDLIVEVGSVSLADRGDDFGLEAIRGPAGSPVTLTFLRGEERHVVSIVRAKIVVPVATWRMLSYHGVRIGYLRLTTFSEDSGEELRTATHAVLREHAEALVLDLRGNGGGLISQAINVASIFLAHGEIVSAVERNQPRRVYDAQGDAIAPEVPLVVLVDHGTASSSEIVTGALQDHGRAKVVGTHTYGKGVFQVTERLNNGGALDITIGEFFTPDGHNLGDGACRQGAGITPNVYAVDDPDTDSDGALTTAERTVAAKVS